jgi:hypothetical protein
MKKVLLLLLVLLPVLGMGTEKLGMGYFIVVANPSLKPVFEEFIKFKQEQGFDVVIEDVSTIEKTVEGNSRGEKIRNWLKKEKTKVGYTKTFTLLVGTIRENEEMAWERKGEVWTGGEIPMLRVEGSFGGKPESFVTDYYYADLDNSKKLPKKVSDFNNEVCNLVGRIPFSLKEVLEKYIQMLLKAEREIAQAKETPRYAFTICAPIFRQPYKGGPLVDMAPVTEKHLIPLIKKSEAYSAIYTLYQKEGKISSSYSCTAPLTGENLVKFLPLTDVLITHGHGGVGMDVWSDTNGNGEIDEEVWNISYFGTNHLVGNLAQLQEKPVKLWIDEGCHTIIQAAVGDNFNSLDFEDMLLSTNALLADEGLRFRIVLNAIGWTGISTTDSSDFISTIFVEKKVIGEVLNISKENAVVYREKKNKEVKVTVISRPGNILFKLCILGDPSFGFFPDSLKNSLPKTHSQK